MSDEIKINANGINVLVVDDNEVNAMVVTSMLEQFSITTTEVYSGKDAVERVKYEDYDIIFMDYLMPEMNGIEATEEIRRLAKAKRPTIVALSADNTQELKQRFQKSGVDDVIAKPLEFEKVCQILSKWLSDDQMQNTRQEDDSKGVDIVQLFSHLDVLNVEKGLSHLANSSENYIKVIEVAAENIDEQRKRLLVYGDSQVQPSAMKICFHSLKGVFLNIGALPLSERSQAFETACANGDVQMLEENLEQYLLQLEEMVTGLRTGLAKYDDRYACNEAEKYMPLEEEEYQKVYQIVVEGLQRFEYNELRDGIQTLIYASKDEERRCMEKVAKLVQGFQYEEALEVLEGQRREI